MIDTDSRLNNSIPLAVIGFQDDVVLVGAKSFKVRPDRRLERGPHRSATRRTANMAILSIGAPRRAGAVSLEQLLANELNPLRATLDSLNANCFIAGLDLTLVYRNRKANQTLGDLGPARRSA
ncbi:MAG TPA: hypothetical protein VIK17_02255 [Cellulomonas sp.]